MEQYMFNLSEPAEDEPSGVSVRPNLWLLTPDEMPPILMTAEEAGRLMGVGRDKVYQLIRCNELRSVKIGAYRRISAKALAEYVSGLELREPA